MPQVFDYLSPIETVGNTFIGCVDAYKICTAVNAWKKYGMERKVPKSVLAFANSVKVTDNPVLMFFTLKRF
ncbi:hypothetical protein D3C86_2100710 [compost metagenome]